MDDLGSLKKKVWSAFKLSGFLVSSEPCAFLAEQLLPLDGSEREKWMNTILKNIQNQRLETANLEKKHIENAINELNKVGLDEGETVFSVINAFEVPTFTYNRQRKKFELDTAPKSLLPNAEMKAKYMAERYAVLLQKTIRHELFSPPVEGTSCHIKKFKLYFVENLLCTSEVQEVVVLGLLTQLTEGKFYIEDPTGVVALDLSEARFHSGFFCEGCFVLAEGRYEENCLKVAGLGFPPPEPASSSRAFFGLQNTWGGPSKSLLKQSQRLLEVERTNTEATIVFLADVCLDNPIVMGKLKQLFLGYDDCPPIAIVLMGPFSRYDGNIYNLKQLFSDLGDLANNCNNLKEETDLILVPAGEDPAVPNILPREPLPKYLTSDLVRKWPRTKLATNPCRLQYCTQQILVCRVDLVTKFCRNTIHFPDTDQLENHFARTLICQGNLAPVDPIALPVYWDYDAALSLYPLPDLVVVGDPNHPFNTTQHGCTILNTGSFVKSKFSFKVYVPSTRSIEDSEIPDESTNDVI